MTRDRSAAGRRIPAGACVALVGIVLLLAVGANPAYAATHIGLTTYSSNTTWTLANSPYVIDGDVTVAAGVTLTVEPGVIVKFNGTARTLRVDGTLSASGTSSSHITFTSLQDDTIGGDTGGDGPTSGAAGQWSWLNFRSSTSRGTFDYVDVRYGGAGSSVSGYGAVEVTASGASVTVTHSTIKWSQASGVYVYTGAATVDSTTVSNGGNGISVNNGSVIVRNGTVLTANSSDGLWFSLPSGLATGSSLMDSDVTSNGRYGVYIASSSTLALSLLPHGSFNNIDGNTSQQLYTATSPSYKNAAVNWRQNYWGNDVYFRANDPQCPGTAPSSYGELAYRGSGTNPPAGPMNGGSYVISQPPPSPGIVCAYSSFKVDPRDMSPGPWHQAGSPSIPLGETLNGCDAVGLADFAAHVGSCSDDPVSGGSGSAASHQSDLRLAGIGVPFTFARTYNSLNIDSGPLGQGWSHSLSANLSVAPNGDVVATSDTGQRLYFTKQPDGSFIADPGGRASLTAIQGGYELVDFHQTHLRFDTAGKLTSVRDRNNQGLTLSYTGNNLTSVTDSASRVINLGYNGSGLLTQVTLPDNRNVQYGYTGGLLTSVTDARGKTTTYAYDSHNWLASETDANGHRVFLNSYGADGRVTEQVDALNRHTTFAWDQPTQTSTVTDARGKVWKDVYSNGVLVQQIDPLNNTTSYGYDSDLNLTSVTDPRGKTTTMSYDSRGNMLSRTAPAPLSYQQTYTYSSLNDVLTVQDGRGNTTSFGYDGAGNLTSMTRPGSNVTQYGRDSSGNGLLRSITDPRGKVTSFDYDAAGNLTAITTALGNKTTMSYDGSGRMTSSVDPRGNVTGADPNDYKTTYTYNPDDQPLSITDPINHTWSAVYDDAGNLTSLTDPLTHITSYAYNAVNKLTSVTAPGGAVTSYGYDAVNDLTSRTDPNNHQTTYAYDDADRLTSVTNPLNKTWSVGYDGNGNRTTVTKPSGGTITVGYDALNRPTGISYSDSTPAVSYSYDANSNRTQMTDGAGTQTYTYDALDQLTAVTRGSDTFTYDYDTAGNTTLRTYPDGTSISSSYDDDERLASVTRSGNTVNYAYNAGGLPIQATLPNGYVESRTYDHAGRIAEIKHSSGANVLAQFDYAYDATGNPTSITTPSGIETYGYDNRDRLASVCYQATCPGGADPFIRWTYDPVGNRLTEARPSGTTSYSYDAADELTQAGSTSYSYNDNGNETQAGSRSFTWNLADRLTSTSDGGTTTNYSYDGDGNRIQAASSMQTTNYLWDTSGALPRLAVERDGSGSPLRSYEYGLGPASMLTGGQNYYFHTDAIGSIRNITGSSGQTEWTYSYEPYGTARIETKNDAMAPVTVFGFAGELIDPTSGLYNLRARVYWPEAGRFLSLDPKEQAASEPSAASYLYGNDDPGKWVDPSGLGPARPEGVSDEARLADPIARQNAPNNDCTPSYVPPIPPPAVPAWKLGYWLACEALKHREEIALLGVSCALGAIGEREITQQALYGGHEMLTKAMQTLTKVLPSAVRLAPILEGPWAAGIACVGAAVAGHFGKQSLTGAG